MTSLTPGQHTTSEVLRDRLSASPSVRELLSGGSPAWFSRLLTDLVLLIDDDEIRYANSTRDEYTFTMEVFTHRYLVWAVIAQPDEQNSVIRLQTVKRSDIVDLSVTATEGLLEQDAVSFRAWPGAVRIAAVYPGIGLVRVPLEDPTIGGDDPAIVPLLAELKADLLGRA